jgi:hypothetical protein
MGASGDQSVVRLAVPEFQTFSRYNVKLIDSARRSAFYERGIDRITDNWRGKGSTGLEFACKHYLTNPTLTFWGDG